MKTRLKSVENEPFPGSELPPDEEHALFKKIMARFGRMGGSLKTPAQQIARARNMRKATRDRMAKRAARLA